MCYPQRNLPNQTLFQPGRLSFGMILFILICLVSRDAAEASFSIAKPLIAARGGHTATLLLNGRLLVVGGQTNSGFTSSVAEFYDPSVGTWTSVGSMRSDRAGHSATMLSNGKVLVAGGFSTVNGALATSELFDPIAGTWTAWIKVATVTVGSAGIGTYLDTNRTATNAFYRIIYL